MEKIKNTLLAYKGENNQKKLNCSQSVIHGFYTYNDREVLLNKSNKYGGGRAPEGLCGAFYSAKLILEKENKIESLSSLEEIFKNKAGSTHCKEIRAKKELSCLGCVTQTAEFLNFS